MNIYDRSWIAITWLSYVVILCKLYLHNILPSAVRRFKSKRIFVNPTIVLTETITFFFLQDISSLACTHLGTHRRKVSGKSFESWNVNRRVCFFFFFFLKFIKVVTDHIYLADFLKTNQTKFTVVWVKKHQKARFLSPRSSKITVTKEKGIKERARRRKGGEEKKKQSLHSWFYNSYFRDSFWPKKTVRRKRSIWR